MADSAAGGSSTAHDHEIERLLSVVCDELGMDQAFIGRITGGRRDIRYVCGAGLRTGDSDLLDDSYIDPVRQAMVGAGRVFAAALGGELVAEGVETEAEFEVLRRLGITRGQGYLFGRPAPAETWTDAAGVTAPRVCVEHRRDRGTHNPDVRKDL